MTLLATVGSYQADSFVEDIEDAEERLGNYGIDMGHWATLVDTAKEFRLKIAAQLMGSGVFPLAGDQVYERQALCFPRTCQNDVTLIPETVIDCQCILAVMVVDLNMVEAEPTTSSTSEVLLDNALIKSVEIMGVLKVGLQNTLNSTTTNRLPTSISRGSMLAIAAKNFGTIAFMLLKPYLAQIRGESALALADYPEKLPSPDWGVEVTP
jgi:hypothetical protein